MPSVNHTAPFVGRPPQANTGKTLGTKPALTAASRTQDTFVPSIVSRGDAAANANANAAPAAAAMAEPAPSMGEKIANILAALRPGAKAAWAAGKMADAAFVSMLTCGALAVFTPSLGVTLPLAAMFGLVWMSFKYINQRLQPSPVEIARMAGAVTLDGIAAMKAEKAMQKGAQPGATATETTDTTDAAATDDAAKKDAAATDATATTPDRTAADPVYGARRPWYKTLMLNWQ